MDSQHPLVRHKDILREMLEYFAPSLGDWASLKDERSRKNRDTLTRCARVCKAFCDPALNILWSHLPSARPLVRLLPSVRKVRRGNLTTSPSIYTLTNALSPDGSELARLRTYSKRVRHLKVDLGSSKVYGSVWQDLSWCLQGGPLIPHLISLTWNHSPLDTTMLTFITSSLQRVKIEFGQQAIDNASGAMTQTDYTLRVILSALATKAPSLSELELQGLAHPSSLVPIMDLVGLRNLACGSFSSGASKNIFRPLGRMESLCTLVLDLSHVTDTSITGCPSGFSALEDLELLGDLHVIPRFLNNVDSQELRAMHLKLSVLSETAAVRAEEFGHLRKSLEKFTKFLESVKISDRPSPERIVANLNEFLRPLDHLNNLVSLHIQLSASIKLDASCEDIVPFFKAWLRLKTFDVCFRNGSQHTSIVILQAIAECCPKLQHFRLPNLDIRALEILDLEAVPVLSHQLDTIRCGDLNLDPSTQEVVRLAQYVDRLFPDLGSCFVDQAQTEQHWVDTLCDMILALRSSRVADRARSKATSP